ncbi:nucleotidyltransferase family protein [Cupriavidus necator]|uniref:Nucleotidyl transferase n=1 Tax=Cupriavidus pinatubonensis (strain JMP 134 / LMG 1197) TaxID=264198 RepID=Q474S9_CUPPJ|nr:nucleotidyltransferase family protein [Cupriavidus necator]
MKPALILAGGLGTRLRAVVGELPKPMADVAGHPFLWWLLKQLDKQGVKDAYLSVGYRHEMVRAGMGDVYGAMRLHYIVEEKPLGTGGAIFKAVQEIPGEDVLVFNGDTLAMVDLAAFVAFADASGADVAMAVARVEDATRYGTVEIDADRRIRAFVEKGRGGPGVINAGVYQLRKRALTSRSDLPARFSFEQDFLARLSGTLHLGAFLGVTDFIDIGIPEDYQTAQTKVPALIEAM